MKLKQLLEQLNQLAKERPEALEMEVYRFDDENGWHRKVEKIEIDPDVKPDLLDQLIAIAKNYSETIKCK